MTRIMVTGALGHIGSRFIRTIQPGDFQEVRLLDNLSTQRYSSLFNLPKDVPFHFVEDDICTANLEEHFADCDVVIHLAAITDAASSFQKQDQVERVNCQGTERVAQACVACGCRMVFLSTTSVYGTQRELADENCSPEELKPQSPYAQSKIIGERMLQQLGEEEGLRFITCRFGTIFGPSIGMRFHTAVNKFVWQACMGLPITVWQTALNQKRPYLDLEDAVRALRFIIDGDHFDKRVYNVATTNATVGQIVDIIHTYVPDLTVTLVDTPIMNQFSYEVSCKRFTELGFAFRGDLHHGIGETVALLHNVRPDFPA